ncbi:hypothetical protein GGF37_000889 [Kickxella alabastrina]|nr:hypothetical protein GGF37_000889 [Kickxella alabastrina]
MAAAAELTAETRDSGSMQVDSAQRQSQQIQSQGVSRLAQKTPVYTSPQICSGAIPHIVPTHRANSQHISSPTTAGSMVTPGTHLFQAVQQQPMSPPPPSALPMASPTVAHRGVLNDVHHKTMGSPQHSVHNANALQQRVGSANFQQHQQLQMPPPPMPDVIPNQTAPPNYGSSNANMAPGLITLSPGSFATAVMNGGITHGQSMVVSPSSMQSHMQQYQQQMGGNHEHASQGPQQQQQSIQQQLMNRQQMQQYIAMSNMQGVDKTDGAQPHVSGDSSHPQINPHSMVSTPVSGRGAGGFQATVPLQIAAAEQNRYAQWQHQQQQQRQHVSPGGPGFSGVNSFVIMQQRHNDGTTDANVNGFNIQNSPAAISPQQASQTMSPVMKMAMAPPFPLIPNSTVHAANTMPPTTAANSGVTPTTPSNPAMLAMATAAAAPADTTGSGVKKAPIRTRARRVPRKPAAAKTAATAKLASDSQPPPSPANQGTVANSGSGNNNNKPTSSPALAMKTAAAMPNSVRSFSVAMSSPSFANATALVNNSGHGLTQAAVNISVTEAEARASGVAGSFVENAFSKMLSQRGNQATLQGEAVGTPKNNADMPSAMGPIDVDGLNLNINQWLRGGQSSDALDNLLSIGMPMNGVPSVAGSAGTAGGDHGGQAASSQIVSPYDISDTALANLITSSGGIVSGNGGGNQGLPGALSTAMPIPVNMAVPSTLAVASALTAAGNVSRTAVDSDDVSAGSNGGVNVGNGFAQGSLLNNNV